MPLFIFIQLFIYFITNINSIIPISNNNIKNKLDYQPTELDFVLIDKNNKEFKLNKDFIEWLVGFTDAKGNFIISVRDNPNYKINTLLNEEKINKVSKYANLTYQIGLRIDDLNTLKFIKKELKCGNISIPKNRCNYYVSDNYSIINIIIPLFSNFQLNSTKYSQFVVFKNAAEIFNNKFHLTNEGLSQLISLKNTSNTEFYTPKIFNITDNWLLGFMEGDATFSTGSIYRPRLKFECHVKEEKLFSKIQEY